MADNKTRETKASVTAYLKTIDHEKRREDCKTVIALMKKITGKRPKMWGTSMIGFGSYHYKYDSGREGDMFVTGVSPRKTALTIYIISGFKEHDALMSKLGKHKTGRSCLYVNKLEDIDMKVLERLIRASVKFVTNKYGS